MTTRRVLVLDDEPDMVENCARILKRAGYQCLTSTDPHRALALVESERPDLLLTDLKMPGIDGLEVLRRAREMDPALPVILITAFATIESAVAAIKDGAFDYLPKNFSVDQLRVAVERGLRQRELQLENRNLKEQLQGALGFENLIGRSPAMTKIFELVRKAARSDANILVLGESGTGKELIARAIHANSPRSTQPFVPVDCASLPEPLLESELFGHEKGAFTGAVATKPGLIELADGGTLFLDEIGEMEPESQVKLLRVLETHAFFRVGGTRRRTVDMRLVAATNRDLAEALKTGGFRQDLFYRINTITITLPPLRDRREDVRRLVEHFLERNAAYGRKRLSDAAMDCLERYDWPGNVRELQHAVQRAVILSQGEQVQPSDLPEEIRGGRAAGAAPGGSLEDMERQHIISTLRSVGGHRAKAATVLGIDPKTLYRKIQAYGISPDLSR